MWRIRDRKIRIWLRLVWLMLLAAMAGGGVWYYRSQTEVIFQRAAETLASVAHLRVSELVSWRDERLSDAALLADDPLIKVMVADYLKNPLESRAKPLLERFRVLAKHFGYTDMLLVDVAGKIRLSLSGATDLEADCKESLSLAAREGCPMLTDLHLNLQKTDPHISVVAPILSGGGDARADLLGKVVLVSGANRFLYPLLQSWPTASGTAETTLARRDGDDALFLNSARHQPDTALRLRVPLSRKDVVAVKAVSGIEGVCNGVDYRNKPVLAFTRAVPGTNWFIAAKQDIDEIIGDWRFISRLTFAVMLSLSLGLFAAVQMVWLRSQAQHYQALYEAEAALRASTDRQSITLRAINDAVLVTDDRGLVEFINPVAARLTGWDESKARGRPLEDVLHIVHEGTRERLPSPPEWGLRGYAASGPDNQMLLIGRDGAECPISVSASPILGGNGSPCGVVLVCRDQTDAENYRTLFRRMLDGFAVHEMIFDEAGKPVDYRFLAVNPAFESMTGLRGTEVVGKTMREVFPGIEQHWFDAYGKVVQTGEPSHFESFAGQLNKFFDVAAFRPAPNQFAVIIQDITPRKKIEIELTESEKKYRSLTDDVLDTTEVGIFILDSAFNVVWVNRTMGRFFGVERDAVVGRPKRTLIKSRLARIFEDPAGFAAKVLATYDDNTYTEKFECHVLAGEGREERWLQHWSQPVRTGLYAGGRIEHYYDITEIKQTEARQRRLVAAIEQSGEIVMVTDPAGVILYVNEAFERVTGYTRPEAIGKTPSILKSGKHGVEFYQQMWQTLLRQEIYRGRLINKRKDGSFYTEDISIAPVSDDAGRTVNYTAVAKDVTDYLRLETELHQSQKMESVGRLAGGVAHDFNNMLGAILGNAELALESLEPDSPVRTDIDEIVQAAKRSAEITQQLLAFARKQVVTPRVLDLNAAIGEMIKMLRRLVGENIALEFNPGASAVTVEIDPSQLHQILANLCVNARDAISDVGAVTISTGVERKGTEAGSASQGRQGAAYAVLTVRDTGCGMDNETLDHLFEPFYTTKAVGKGTGLGLATVHGIVKQNNGLIRVWSAPGQGTQFTISLPLYAGAAEGRDYRTPEVTVRGHGETVLIAEDEDSVLRLSRAMLEKLGYKVLCASTPRQALRLAEASQEPIDLLLTDVIMPEMNGRDLAEKLKLKYPDIRCLYMSGYTADVVAHHGVLDMNVCFIQKPFSLQELAVSVAAALGGMCSQANG